MEVCHSWVSVLWSPQGLFQPKALANWLGWIKMMLLVLNTSSLKINTTTIFFALSWKETCQPLINEKTIRSFCNKWRDSTFFLIKIEGTFCLLLTSIKISPCFVCAPYCDTMPLSLMININRYPRRAHTKGFLLPDKPTPAKKWWVKSHLD